MPMHSSYIAEELRLDLSFSGNLDVSVSQDICDICWSPPRDLKTCIVDISGIDRLFDSGVALLKMLHQHLVKKNVLVVILSDSPKNRKRMPNTVS
jgi:ABC-type transporter Mla MlaB component